MIKRQEWSPDTCTGDVSTGCTVEVEVDTTSVNPEMTLVRFIRVCPHHATITNVADRYGDLLAENRRKNHVVADCEAGLGVTPDSVKWKIDKMTRALEIEEPDGIETGKVKSLKDTLTAKYGNAVKMKAKN